MNAILKKWGGTAVWALAMAIISMAFQRQVETLDELSLFMHAEEARSVLTGATVQTMNDARLTRDVRVDRWVRQIEVVTNANLQLQFVLGKLLADEGEEKAQERIEEIRDDLFRSLSSGGEGT